MSKPEYHLLYPTLTAHKHGTLALPNQTCSHPSTPGRDAPTKAHRVSLRAAPPSHSHGVSSGEPSLQVCVKRADKQQAKLEKQDFTGIFPGHPTNTMNMYYLDLYWEHVKTCSRAMFDNA